MEISTATNELEVAGKKMPLYIAKPNEGGPHPALVVFHEAFGLNNHIQDATRRLAGEGYVAIAPDLFFREDTKILAYDQLPRARELMARMVDDVLVEDIRRVVDYLHGETSVAADRIGVIGWCWGGRIAFLSACRLTGFKAMAIYYAGRIVQQPTENAPVPPVDMAQGIQCPVLGSFGEEDRNPSVDDVNLIAARLRELGKTYDFKIYPGAGHGFFCDERPSYQREAAQDAWMRTLAFFEQHLKS